MKREAKVEKASLMQPLPSRPEVLKATLRKKEPHPPAVERILEVRHRQAAMEVWYAAVNLQGALELARYTYDCATEGKTVSDEFQRAVLDMFGDLQPFAKLQDLLHHIAAYPTTRRAALVEPPSTPFPREECRELFALLVRQIEQFSGALVNHRIDSNVFDDLTNVRWEHFYVLWDWAPSGADPKRQLKFSRFPQEECNRLYHEADAILRRLRSDPTRVVPAPTYPNGTFPIVIANAFPPVQLPSSTPDWKERLTVDATNGSITFDGTVYSVSKETATWIYGLWLAEGRTRTHNDLAKDFPILEKKRPNRLWNQLPKPIQELIDSQPGAGTRILIEKLA